MGAFERRRRPCLLALLVSYGASFYAAWSLGGASSAMRRRSGAPDFQNLGQRKALGPILRSRSVALAARRAARCDARSSPATLELEACDASGETSREDAHGCQKPQRS